MGVQKLHETYTYDQYLTWSDEKRWELLHGVPCDISPVPSRRHQEIVQELSGQFYNFLLDKPCQVYPAPFDVRFQNERGIIDTVVQPDLSVICDIKKLDDRGCSGAPDLVVEILSPATASKDLKEKLSLYETHGVKEYWIVDPHDYIFTPVLLKQIKTIEKVLS